MPSCAALPYSASQQAPQPPAPAHPTAIWPHPRNHSWPPCTHPAPPTQKWKSEKKEYPLEGMPSPTNEETAAFVNALQAGGVKVLCNALQPLAPKPTEEEAATAKPKPATRS